MERCNMPKPVFNKDALVGIYNGTKKIESGFGMEKGNECDAIQELFTILADDDLAEAHTLYNAAIKYVNGNNFVKTDLTKEQYEERRDKFFDSLGIEIRSGKAFVKDEIEEGMDR